MTGFYVANLRHGHATNSSSSHSLILLGKGRKALDEYRDDHDGGRFGWDSFICASKDAKRLYLGLMARSSGLLSAIVADHDNDIDAGCDAIDEVLGYRVPRPSRQKQSWGNHDSYLDWDGNYDEYVDHNSVPTLVAHDWDRQTYPTCGVEPGDGIALLTALRDFFDREDVLVAGGNDNSDGFYPDRRGSYFSPGYMTIRKTANGYIFWGRWDGLKLRLVRQDDPIRPVVPELVDIKITDYCPLGCEWCYQGSTVDGEHGELENIKLTAKRLGEAGVLEVAIGGGEPTMHPEIVEILAAFNNADINANFTTRSLAWLKQEELFDAISTHARAFAFSVDSAEQVVKLQKLFKEANDRRQEVYRERARKEAIAEGKDPERVNGYVKPLEVNLHYVMGSTPLEELTNIFHAMEWPIKRVTLLGYKTTERGADFEPHDYTGWYDVALASEVDISVDTTLVRQSEGVLRQNVNAAMYHLEEGLYSMYVDAVAMTMAPSSYEPEREHVPFDEDWQRRFQQFKVDLRHEVGLRDAYHQNQSELARY